MNKGFITALIVQKNNIPIKDEKNAAKLLLKIPSINQQFTFCHIQAYAVGDIAQKISTFCMVGEYLFLEGFIWTITELSDEVLQSQSLRLLFIITDMQPVF